MFVDVKPGRAAETLYDFSMLSYFLSTKRALQQILWRSEKGKTDDRSLPPRDCSARRPSDGACPRSGGRFHPVQFLFIENCTQVSCSFIFHVT